MKPNCTICSGDLIEMIDETFSNPNVYLYCENKNCIAYDKKQYRVTVQKAPAIYEQTSKYAELPEKG